MMNEGLKEVIGAVIYDSLCEESNINFDTMAKLYRNMKIAVENYLNVSLAQPTAALQSQLQEKQSATYDLEKEIKKSVDDWYRKAQVDVRGDLGNRMFNIARAYAASLQVSETVTKSKETFTARDARSAVAKARTCEGFIQNILEDIKYKAECGITKTRITVYVDTYKYEYLQKLYDKLDDLNFSVEHRRQTVNGRPLLRVTISW